MGVWRMIFIDIWKWLYVSLNLYLHLLMVGWSLLGWRIGVGQLSGAQTCPYKALLCTAHGSFQLVVDESLSASWAVAWCSRTRQFRIAKVKFFLSQSDVILKRWLALFFVCNRLVRWSSIFIYGNQRILTLPKINWFIYLLTKKKQN